ncbi:hypothetical protein NBM05_07175 [Rothia sp. AR01]|uniref:Folylpolyglutamate synthase n=1 Tax=Rothia santali TaxID=2949643 RepID=A0A9X2HFF8_9MICC|nr:hypothetical protein [Rothia santali]MCP3425792.1 hypothetical protein [Rothia santali]
MLGELLRAAGLPPGGVPAVVVTGSKGKGQAATTAAAHLTAAGLRTGLVTSPGILSNLDRFALDGRVVPAGTYHRWLGLLERAVATAPPPAGTYLAPTGLFTVLGHAMLAAEGADVVVHEAGLGGARDEVSLFDPLAVGLTSVLREHLDVFGPTLEHVAREKFGLVHGPAPVVSVPQAPGIAPLLERVCAGHGAPLRIAPAGEFSEQNAAVGRLLAAAAAERWGTAGTGHPGAVSGRHPGAAALGRPRAASGSRPGAAAGEADVVVERPGRGQVYRTAAGARVMVDACIDVTGWEVALRRAREAFGADPAVYWSLPLTKPVEELADWLDARGLEHRFVTLDSGHLDYRLPERLTERLRPLGLPEALGRLAGRGGEHDAVLAAGTISFGTAVLVSLGVTLERLYRTGP